jgi:type I restriction enzyme M protein
VDEIVANDYDLSINKYKEVEKVKVEYENPKTVFKRIAKLQDEINAAMDELGRVILSEVEGSVN